MWQLQLHHPEKVTHSKSWGPAKPPFFENLVGGSTPPPPLPCRKEKGVHTMCVGICMCDSMLLLKGLLYHQFMTTGKYFIIGMKINFLVKFSLLLVQKSGHLENTSFKSYWLNFNFRHVFYCMNFTPKKQNLLPLNKMPIQLKQG